MAEEEKFPPYREHHKLIGAVLKHQLAEHDVDSGYDENETREDIGMAAQEYVRAVNAMKEEIRPYWWKATHVEALEGEVGRLKYDVQWLRASLDRNYAAIQIFFEHTRETPLTPERQERLRTVLDEEGFPKHAAFPSEAIVALGKALAGLVTSGREEEDLEELVLSLGETLGIAEPLLEHYHAELAR